MFTTWQIIGLALLGLLACAVDFWYHYTINITALNRGFGKGRDAVDWALRGMSGAGAYVVTGPNIRDDEENKAKLNLEHMYCPKCKKTRLTNDGFCTVCGTQVIEALIDEARDDDPLDGVRVLTYDEQVDQLHNPKQEHPGAE